jgi:hypothetical protein
MTKKYRPYLSLPELRHLVSVLTQHEPTSQLCRYFARYLLDVESGFRSPNHTLQPSLEDKLGFGSGVVRTKHESEQQYRYDNDLMSKQEEYEYEVSQGLHK